MLFAQSLVLLFKFAVVVFQSVSLLETVDQELSHCLHWLWDGGEQHRTQPELRSKDTTNSFRTTCQNEDLWVVNVCNDLNLFFNCVLVKMRLTVVHTAFRNTLETVGETMKTNKYSFLFWKKKQEVQLRLHSNTASVVSWQMTMTNYEKHVSLVFIDNTHTQTSPQELSLTLNAAFPWLRRDKLQTIWALRAWTL